MTSAPALLGHIINYVYYYVLLSFREANTIFRGNSLAARCIDDMMKIVGKSYLTVTLKPVIDEVRVT